MKRLALPELPRTGHRLVSQSVRMLLVAALGLPASVLHTDASTIQWQGQPGVTATINWSDPANWNSAQQTYYNQVQFSGVGANAAGDLSVNTILDSATAAAQMPIWQLDFNNTGGNYVTLINPGVTLRVDAGNGWMTVGAPGTPVDAAEIIKFTGDDGAMSLEGGWLTIGQSATAPGNHNVTLDLSGLGRFQKTGARLLVAATGNHGHGTFYLAKTNVINLDNDITICWQGGTSNSLPCALYLGQSNWITTGSGNNNIMVGQSGGTNAILAFNPALVNTVPAPTAAFGSSANGGRGNLWVAANGGSPNAPAYGLCDFSGGQVTMLEDSIQLGQAGNSTVASALGVLKFDNGSIDVNTVVVGNQTTTAAGAGAGMLVVGTNATQGANATLTVNNSLTLASVTGTPVAGSAGTLDINGGVVNADTITSGGGAASINVTAGVLSTKSAGSAASPLSTLILGSSRLQVKIASADATNVVVNSLTTAGANKIDIVSLPSIGAYPFQVPVIQYAGTIGGAGFNFSLGTLPPLAVGYISNNTARGTIDLVLTDGPRTLRWTGATSGDWDTTTANWFASSAVTYKDGSFVSFLDGATRALVNLTAAFAPGSLMVSNSSLDYTFAGSGYLSGSAGLLKAGSGKLTLDNSGANAYAGNTVVTAGTLQVGANDNNGNLPSGPVNNSGTLIFARNDNVTVNNAISGSGLVEQAGSGSLILSGANTFSGSVLVTNGSLLQVGSASALGTGAGATIVANGSTLDFNGYYLNAEPIVLAGSGVGGMGAIVNGGGAVYGLSASLTLAGDTTFGISSRWDLDGSAGAALSSGGQPYSVTLQGSGYFQWKRLHVDSALGDINVTSGMNFGVVGSTTLGNPANALTLAAGSQLTFYADDVGVSVNKRVIFNDGAKIANGWWWNTIAGPIVFTNSSGSGYCEVENNSDPLTFSGELTGNGILYKTGSGGLILSGNSPAFAGGVYILGGTVSANGALGNPLGITVSYGRFNFNGALSGSGGVTSSAGTTVAGSGSTTGAMDIGGSLVPGDNGVVGTMTVGNLTLESGATVTSDLGAIAAGANDLVQVNGSLTVNGNTLYVNPVAGTLENGRAYTLITYTGTLNGSFGGVSTVSASTYTFQLTNVTTTTPKKIQAIVTGGQPSVLTWNNAMGSGEWDTQMSANWSNLLTHVSQDYFYAYDIVLFDDSVTNSPAPTTTIDVATGLTVTPSAITNNSTLDYTLTGAGEIGGSASLTKRGSSTLTLDVTGSFTGPVNISGGKVKTTKSALGSVSAITITNNSTLDFSGNTLSGAKPVTVSGTGLSGAGALYNSGGDIYGNVLKVSLAGDTIFGSSSRWDLASGSSIAGPYKLTIQRSASGGYGEWDTVTVSNNVGDIELAVGKLGIKNMGSSFGDPTRSLLIDDGTELDIYSGGCNRTIHVRSNGTLKVVWNGSASFSGGLVLDETATMGSYWGGASVFNGGVTLNGTAHIFIGDADCTFNNVLSGSGGFLTYYWNHRLILTASNTYTGPTVIGNGMVVALNGSGSIEHSSLLFFGGSSPTSTHIDVTGRADQTLTLGSGQSLAGIGAVSGNLVVSPGATVSPGGTNTTLGVNLGANATGTISATGNITLNGTTVIKLRGAGTSDAVNAGGSITYSGALSLVNIGSGPLAAGDSFTIFGATSRSGSFASITPATPGDGLAWDTTQLGSGILRVVSATPSQPRISSITMSGGNLLLSGTNGPTSGSYYVLSSTNVAAPLGLWTVLATNSFNNGSFSFSYPVSGEQRRFFMLQVP